MKKNKTLKVSIVMGSQSDYKTMNLAEKILKKIGVSFETRIISAHRTPKRMYDYASSAEKGWKCQWCAWKCLTSEPSCMATRLCFKAMRLRQTVRAGAGRRTC